MIPAPDRNRNGVLMLGVQCKMARVALGWGVRDLATKAKVSTQTVSRLEAGEELRDRTVAAIRAVFVRAGIEFIDENGGGPGVRLAKRRKR